MLSHLPEHLRKVYLPKEPTLPAIHLQAINAARAVGRIAGAVLRAEPIFVSEGIFNERLEICTSCPKYIPSKGKCSICGCITAGRYLAKLKLATEQCPDKPPRWLRIEPAKEI